MKNLSIILLSACAGGLLSGMLTRSCQTEIPPEIQTVTDTLTITRVDTITIVKPQPYKVVVRDTIVVNSFQNSQDWKVLVQEIKEYKDSTYYARISGINAYLEEIRVYPKTITQYITTTETIFTPPRKWSIGIQAGYGAGKNGIQPYIGVGIQYDLLRF
jgi:hypothetical protein